MERRNCPNCGAPIDYEKNKCDFCGTSYYDLSCMKMHEPFFLRINLKPYSDEILLVRVGLNTTNVIFEPDSFPEIELNLTAFELRREIET